LLTNHCLSILFSITQISFLGRLVCRTSLSQGRSWIGNFLKSATQPGLWFLGKRAAYASILDGNWDPIRLGDGRLPVPDPLYQGPGPREGTLAEAEALRKAPCADSGPSHGLDIEGHVTDSDRRKWQRRDQVERRKTRSRFRRWRKLPMDGGAAAAPDKSDVARQDMSHNIQGDGFQFGGSSTRPERWMALWNSHLDVVSARPHHALYDFTQGARAKLFTRRRSAS
jgi:hypothetical protein